MHRPFSVLLITLIVSLIISDVFAAPLTNSPGPEVKATFKSPDLWEDIGEAPGHHEIKLTIVLHHKNSRELERHLYEGLKEARPLEY